MIHPLLEAGVGKALVRALAEQLGVPSARKPASPCLASRIPYGTPVDRRATLRRIDRAERALKALGYRVLRVRHHGEIGRLELAAEELPGLLGDPGGAPGFFARSAAAGYARAEIDERRSVRAR